MADRDKNIVLERILKEINEFSDFQTDHLTDVNFKGSFGDTPLHVAAVWGDVAIIELLLNFGASIDAIGEDGHTPLHDAVEQGNLDAVKCLLNRGCSRSIKNENGHTARQLADFLGENVIFELLSE